MIMHMLMSLRGINFPTVHQHVGRMRRTTLEERHRKRKKERERVITTRVAPAAACSEVGTAKHTGSFGRLFIYLFICLLVLLLVCACVCMFCLLPASRNT